MRDSDPVTIGSPEHLDRVKGEARNLADLPLDVRKRGTQVAVLATLEKSALPIEVQLAILYNAVVNLLGTVPTPAKGRGTLINAATQDFRTHLQHFFAPPAAQHGPWRHPQAGVVPGRA